MLLNLNLLGLPASILLLVIAQTSAIKFGRNERAPAPQPREIEDNESLLENRSPVGVMKMSSDEGEKFYHEYWQYEPILGKPDKLEVPLRRGEDAGLLANVSMHFTAPLGLHTDFESSYEDLKARKLLEGRNAAAALAILEKRDFVCPTGYNSCMGIGYPNSCCSTGETCFRIQDTGLGPVGCCQNGYTCGGTITTCGSVNTACSSDLGGGCCIPNFTCAGVGCVLNSNVVTTTITQIFTVSVFPSSTRLTTIVTVSTSTSSPSSSSTSSVQSVSSTTTITTTTSSISLTGTSSGTGIIGVRPTSRSSSSSTISTTTTAPTETSCPTGFYGCSAYYRGGCCRTGRDCNTTSCPPVSSTTIISSGVTIVVPVGSAATVTSPTGTCATGWSSCAASVGGNCCLSGWECGTASCSSVGPSSTVVQQKASPNAGSTGFGGRGLLVLGGVVGAFWTGMIMI